MDIIIDTVNFTLFHASIRFVLNKYHIENWNQNRSPDTLRIDDMVKKYASKDIVPGIIYAYKKENKLIIIDGIHRFEAFKIINNDVSLILQIYKEHVSNDIIMSEFVDINSSVPLPELYKNIEDKAKKASFCEKIVSKLIEKWPKHVSPSRFNQPQNFNRDNVIEMISNLDIIFSQENIIVVYNLLLQLNEQSRKKIQDMSIQVPRKCYINNCFLFYMSFEYIKNFIEIKMNHANLISL